MCNISRETILRAQKKACNPSSNRMGRISKDGILTSTRYRGRIYAYTISYTTIRDNYSKALETVKIPVQV